MNEKKAFDIPKELVWQAFKIVRTKSTTPGIDKETLVDFEKDLKNNLYRIWNRLASGTYFFSPLRGVAIPKKKGGTRMIWVSTVSDKVAQTTIKLAFEPLVESIFLEDSYGYRPNKSPLDAIGVVRKRCWGYWWSLEFDIKDLFDSINHDLLMKAVRHRTNSKWILLYIERYLKSPMKMLNGTIVNRTCGTPQGGTLSPVLSNLFMHYVFDIWMSKEHPKKPWVRYADDGLVHCKSEEQAKFVLSIIKSRLKKYGLEIHPEKTKIIYHKDSKRRLDYPNTKFTFLGYEFRRRVQTAHHNNELYVRFAPAISPEARKNIFKTLRQIGIRRRSDLSLEELAAKLNPMIAGWINYYGKYNKKCLHTAIGRPVNSTLIRWAMCKYRKKLKSRTKARWYMIRLSHEKPYLFEHWKQGLLGPFL